MLFHSHQFSHKLFVTDSHLNEHQELKTIMLNANLACLKMNSLRNKNSVFLYPASCCSNPLGMREVVLKNGFVLLFL